MGLILQFLGEKAGWNKLLNLTQREAESRLESLSAASFRALFCFSAFPEAYLPPGDSGYSDFTSAVFPQPCSRGSSSLIQTFRRRLGHLEFACLTLEPRDFITLVTCLVLYHNSSSFWAPSEIQL